MKIWIICGAAASAEEWERGLQAGGAAALGKSGIEVCVYPGMRTLVEKVGFQKFLQGILV